MLSKHFISRNEAVPKLDDSVISAIQSPVLMLYGLEDAFFNFKKAAKRLSSILPESEIQLYKGGKHGLISMAETILPFLRS